MFDFLADGTEKALSASIEAAKHSDPDALTAQCEAAVNAASVTASLKAMNRTEKAFIEALTPIARYARRTADTLPLPTGIFVSEEERKRAYTCLLDALPCLHRLMQTLRQTTTPLMQLRTLLDTRQANAATAGYLLSVAGAACAPKNGAPPSLSALDKRLKQENERASALEEVATSYGELLITFCDTTATAFFLRAEQVGDLSGGGKAADPYESVRLLDGLARQADLFLDEILLTERRLSSLF